MPIIFTKPKRIIDYFVRDNTHKKWWSKNQIEFYDKWFDKGFGLGYEQAIKDMKSSLIMYKIKKIKKNQ